MPKFLIRFRYHVAVFFAVIGPGFITAVVDNDSGGIITYSDAGARFGYLPLWTLLPITVLLIITQEMCSRMGAVTGKGLSDLIREEFGLRITFFLMAILVLVNLTNVMSEFAGIASSLGLFGISRYITVPLSALAVWFLVVKGNYHSVEKICLFACVVYITYVISGFLVKPDWKEAAINSVKPVLLLEPSYIYMLLGMVGTTIAPWMQFYLQAAVVEKGVTAKEYAESRIEVIVGCVMTAVIAFFIIVACAGAIYSVQPKPIEDAADAAKALKPFGEYAYLLFSAGLFNASIFAACILPLSTAYSVCEGLGFESGVNKRLREAPIFYFLYTLLIVAGSGVILIPHFPLVKMILLSQVLNGILLPVVLIFMVLLINKHDLMGEWVNPRWFNLVSWFTVVVIIGLTLAWIGISVRGMRQTEGMSPRKLFINGCWEDSVCDRFVDVCNPATGEHITTVPDADSCDVDRAVAAARASFEKKTWRGMDPSKRERILWNIADLLTKYRDEMGALITSENGKTLRESAGADVLPAADCFRYYAGWVRKIYGETIPVDGPFFNYTLREPVGVVGAIVPWNFPLQIAAWKVAPALACGCSVVLKPSELTPLNALRFAEIVMEAGLPEGVLNVVTGYGSTTGEALALHGDVDKISFTGSVATARKLLHSSSVSNLKRLSLELGGKSPNIVFPDADMDQAVKAALWGIFGGKGEVCSAASRLLVHQDAHDRFLEDLAARARKLRVGNPLDPATQMGSQISARQMDRILDYIESGKQEGAQVLAGGERDTEGDKAKGFFVKPTVFCGVKPEMKIAREEIFGPVVSAIRFSDADEAVRIANGTVYGLAAAVWTRDVRLAHRMAAEIKAGSVWINTYNSFDSGSPFGGYKQSGFGRDLGSYALDQYTNVKSVWVAL